MSDNGKRTLANYVVRLSAERDWLIYWALRSYQSTRDEAIRWGTWRVLTSIGIDPDSRSAAAILERGEPRMEREKHGTESKDDESKDGDE